MSKAMLAEQTFAYEGKDWPPKGSKGDGFIIEGTVVTSFPLSVRKAKELTGFLKQTAAADVADKRTGVVITVSGVQNAKTKAPYVPLAR
jgi:hypothetical protein